MSSFTSPLVVSPLPDGKNWRLVKKFTYRVGSRYSRRFINVPAGFLTDWASVPKFLFWLLPWWAKFSKPFPLHDWLYKTKSIMGKPITRKEADDIFLEAMLVAWRHHRSRYWVAHLEYYAVRLFGFWAWRANPGALDKTELKP